MAKRSPAALYRSMHNGLEARVRTLRVRTPKALIDLRRMTAFEGTQLQGPDRVQGSGAIRYRHEFAPGTGPMVMRDTGRARNNMYLAGGSYRINDEGMVEDMAKSHDLKHYTKNPEAAGAWIVMIGLAVAVVAIANEIVQALLPARWNHAVKAIGVDAVLLAGGIWTFKKSKTWGIALGATAVADAVGVGWVGLGLDRRLRSVFHLPVTANGAVRTYATVNQIASVATNADGSFGVTYQTGSGPASLPATTSPAPVIGSFYVTYSDGTNAVLPPSSAPTVGASGRVFYAMGEPRRIEGGWNPPQRLRAMR